MTLCAVRIFAPLAAAALLAAAPAGGAEEPVSWRAEGGEIAAPLVASPGDPARGRAIAAGRDGNCLACHEMPVPEEQFHGTVGPSLHDAGARLTAGQLRLRLVDPKRIDERTIMPAYYVVEGLTRVAAPYAGRPILTAQQIEDVVAYLLTLTGETGD